MLRIESEQEADGRWIAEVPALPGVLTYGSTKAEADAKVKALALRVIADRLDDGEQLPSELTGVFCDEQPELRSVTDTLTAR